MLKNLISLSVLFSFTVIYPCYAEKQDAAQTPISSDEMSFQAEKAERTKLRNNITKQVYDSRNNNLMREYIRNSNAIKKYMDLPQENIDVSDKSAINRYIQKDAGVFYEPQKVEIISIEDDNKTSKVNYKSRAFFDLKID